MPDRVKASNRLGISDRARSSSTPPAPAEEALFVKLRAYFECRSRNVDPPPALAEAWDQIYKRYTPQIRAFLRGFNLQEADREDCLQDVWSRVVSGSSYDPKRARASNVALDHGQEPGHRLASPPSPGRIPNPRPQRVLGLASGSR